MLLNCGVESPLDCKEIKPVYPKGNQSWISIGKTDVKGETTVLWLPDVKYSLTGKDPDAGKDWRQEEKGMTEDEIVGWHHWLYGHKFDQARWVSDRQGTLLCCSVWGRKVRHNWVTELKRVPPVRKLPQVSFPHPSEGRQNENHNHRKITNLITWTRALSNSV